MRLLLKLAWRNLWRNKRRTLITALAVVFATFLAIAMRGIQLGTYESNIANALSTFAGYIQLQAPGFQENPSLHKTILLNDHLRRVLSNDPAVKGFAPRVYADGLVSYRSNSLGSALFGIVPEREHTVGTLVDKVNDGRFFTSDTSDNIVLGHTLLQNLNARIGDTVVILAQGFDGTLGNERFTITGTIKTGSPEFDAIGVFVGLSRLQQLLAMDDRIHVVALALGSIHQIDDVTHYLTTSLDTSTIAVLPWQKVLPDLEQSIELDNVSGIIFLGILIVVVAFGILNTVLMSVTERFREFGVLLSLGMRQTKLVDLVFLETIMITLIGVLVGNLLAWGVNSYLIAYPIHFTGDYAAIIEEYGFLPILKSSLDIRSFMNTTLSVVVISLISTIYPLYRTYRLQPLKGIRYT
jgi:putative ABC transport system permease protein